MLSGWIVSSWSSPPWKLAKAQGGEEKQQLDDALYASAETLRIAVALLHPVLPQSTANIWAQLGMTEPLETLQLADLAWGQLKEGQSIGQIAPVFPRIESKPPLNGCGFLKKLKMPVSWRSWEDPGCSCRAGGRGQHSAAFPEDRYRGSSARWTCGWGRSFRRTPERFRQAAALKGRHRRTGAAHHPRRHRALLRAGETDRP